MMEKREKCGVYYLKCYGKNNDRSRKDKWRKQRRGLLKIIGFDLRIVWKEGKVKWSMSPINIAVTNTDKALDNHFLCCLFGAYP